MGIFLKKYAWVINLFLIFLGTYFLAKITATFIDAKIRIPKNYLSPNIAVSGRGTKSLQSFEDYHVIMERNIFDSRELAPEAPETTEEPTETNLEGPAVKTSLPIKLISTFSAGDGTDRRSSATITNGGKLDTYTVSDEKQFSPGVKITKILPDRVEFINGNHLEFVALEEFGEGMKIDKPISALEGAKLSLPGQAKEEAGGVKQLEQGKYVVDRAEVDNALNSLDKLFTQIRAVPQFKDGKAAGLRLLSVRSGSLFAKLGLRRNDVLERINGQTIDMKRGLEIFNSLKDSEQISIDLVRNGRKTTLEYNIQ